jgi:transposase-like protein
MGVESARVPIEPERVTRNGRRFFSEEHKRAVVERCLASGASVSAVSLAHGFRALAVGYWGDSPRSTRSGSQPDE